MKLIHIAVSVEKDVYHVKLTGELDACSSIVLDQALEEAARYNRQNINIDCGELCYISSAGIGAIISHLHIYKENQIDLLLYNVHKPVYAALELVGLNKYINIQVFTLSNPPCINNL